MKAGGQIGREDMYDLPRSVEKSLVSRVTYPVLRPVNRAGLRRNGPLSRVVDTVGEQIRSSVWGYW